MVTTETKGREAEIRERLEDIRRQERELAAELRRLEDAKVVNSVWPRRFRVRVESWKTLTDDGGEVKFPSFDTSITLFFDIYEDGSRILVGAQQEEGQGTWRPGNTNKHSDEQRAALKRLGRERDMAVFR